MENTERLQYYSYDDYDVVVNFATFQDAIDYGKEKNGELIEVGFTDGSDNPTPNSSAQLIEKKKAFQIEIPNDSSYKILYSDSEGFQDWAQQILEDKKILESDTAPEDWLSDQNISPGDRVIILKDGTLNTVTTRERMKFLMRGNVYELAVKVPK